LGKVRQAKANAQAAFANLRLVKAKVSYDLKSAFEGFVYAKAYEKLTQEIIQRREDNLKLVQMRFQSGRENQGSVLLSQAYLNQAKYDDLQARNAEKVAQAQLARVLGEDEWTRVTVQGQVPIQPVNMNESPDFRSIALSTPDFEQAKAQEESAESAITIARSQFFPTVTVTGTAGKQGTTFFPDTTNRWTVSVNLSIPIFNGGKDYFSTKSAISSWVGSLKSRENGSRQVLAKLESAYASYTESVLKYQVDESFQKAANVRAEIARTKYNNGLLSFEDWDIIENDLISRQKVFLQSKRDRVTFEAAWEQAQGKGVIP
jgi:outer membrane protein TolC